MKQVVWMNLDDYKIFANNKNTLKELSKDNSVQDNIQYMTESFKEAVDFDKVKSVYVNTLGRSEDNAASVDALLFLPENVVFIEFKNGKVNNRNIKDKIRDSLLLFCDITEKNISVTRQEAEFILVYNLEKNPLPNQLKKEVIQPSSSRVDIAKYISKKGGKEFILFDLERYQGLYFKKVHTYSKQEFEDFLSEQTD